MLELTKVSIRSGGFELRDISLRLESGEYGVMMGRTGSGKTTVLEAVCGLRTIEAGSVRVLDEEVSRIKPSRRGIGYVPQDGALFSTMTVREQLGFALVIRKAPKAAIVARVAELSEFLGIPHLLGRYPAKLSGGEKQRVAMGRALSFEPRVLLLDEPLSAVDEETREAMYVLLKSAQRRMGFTALHVTHNTDEAQALADRVFRLQDGAVHAVAVGGDKE